MATTEKSYEEFSAEEALLLEVLIKALAKIDGSNYDQYHPEEREAYDAWRAFVDATTSEDPFDRYQRYLRATTSEEA